MIPVNRRWSRLLILTITGTLLALAGCGDSTSAVEEPGEKPEPPGQNAEPPAQVIGVNVNGQYDVMKFENVERSGTTWVRGFLDFFQLYPHESNLETDERVQNYIRLKERGYKNILNLKWNFSDRSFPAAESQEMQDYKAYLQKLLDTVWSSTDIIVVGNEPFIESRRAERDNRLVVFYQEIANYVRNYRSESGRDVPIYVGAFNNLYLEGWRTEAANDLMGFARNNSWIAGIDLHIHHAQMDQINAFIDYASLRIRDEQKILITEFSIKDYFRGQMDGAIPGGFADAYGYERDMQNYEYLDYALKNTVPRPQWVDFLSGSPWFEDRKHYVGDAFQRFEGYEQFHVATYALRQSYPFNTDFTANTTPWILNGLFGNRTIQAHPETGQEQFNYAWMDDFQQLPKRTDQ